MKIELIPLPSKDVEQSKKFYVDVLGFHLDHDVKPGNGLHIVQLTPPGSACSIAIGTGIGTEHSAPVNGIHLVVADIDVIRHELTRKGLDITEVSDMGGVKYAYFSDPTGNSWALQQINRTSL